jgi:hypothetical protein
MSWPAGRHPTADDGYPAAAEPRSAPVPVPAGRGRWRLTLHRRRWSAGDDPSTTLLAELPAARGRRLDRNWCQPATFTFSLDSARPEAALISELQTEVVAWRWREDNGQDWPMFAGPVCQAQDQLSEQANTVTFTCHDYLALLARRIYTSPAPWTFSAVDQDSIANQLVGYAANPVTGTGNSLLPGGYLPVVMHPVDPTGNNRAYSGVARDRTYYGSSIIGDLLDQLAKVQGGFDYDMHFAAGFARDVIRVFYPYQGQARTSPVLLYGSTISALSRTVNSADYGNFWRVLGNNGSSDPNAAQLYGEAYNSDATATQTGLWMSAANAADVNQQNTLTQQAQGDLDLAGVLTPVYTLTLRPGTYQFGLFDMGDVLPLIVLAGRLNVNTTVRVLGISFDIGDDGQEDVILTVGRPAVTLPQLLAANNRDVNALNRR